MHKLFLPPIPMVALTGCANPANVDVLPKSVQAGSYDYVPADNSSTRHRIVAVTHDRNRHDLDLRHESGQQLALSPVGSAWHRIYSGPLYAWRTASDMSVLTDVENIQTYNCRYVGGGQAAALVSGRTAP